MPQLSLRNVATTKMHTSSLTILVVQLYVYKPFSPIYVYLIVVLRQSSGRAKISLSNKAKKAKKNKKQKAKKIMHITTTEF